MQQHRWRLAALGVAAAGALTACSSDPDGVAGSATQPPAFSPASTRTTPTTTPANGRFRFYRSPLAFSTASGEYWVYVRMNRPLPRSTSGVRGLLLLNGSGPQGINTLAPVRGRNVCYAANLLKENGPVDPSLYPFKNGLKVTVGLEDEAHTLLVWEIVTARRAHFGLDGSPTINRAFAKVGCVGKP